MDDKYTGDDKKTKVGDLFPYYLFLHSVAWEYK